MDAHHPYNDSEDFCSVVIKINNLSANAQPQFNIIGNNNFTQINNLQPLNRACHTSYGTRKTSQLSNFTSVAKSKQ